MRKRILWVLGLVLVLCGSIWSCSNDDPSFPTDNPNSPLVEKFLSSEYGISTLKKHGLSIADLDLKNSTSEFFNSKGVTALIIPIKENGKITSRLNAFIIPSDNSYRAIVEKWKKVSDKEYSVTVSTGLGAYIATVGIIQDGRKTTQKIINIASISNNNVNSKSQVVVDERETWWACTTRVYHEAKEACSGDSQCDFICELLDLAAGCTVSVAAAAAIVCI